MKSEIEDKLDLEYIKNKLPFVNRLLDWNFEEIEVNGNFDNYDEGNSKIYAMHHKSFWDPIILTEKFYTERDCRPEEYIDKIEKKKRNALLIAAGEHITNLPFLGKRAEKVGAFTVNNDMKSLINLRDNMSNRLSDGYDILIFPEIHKSEKGRRTGRSLNGKIGEFSTLYLHAAEKACKNNTEIDLIPVDITYETIPEEKTFGKANSGKIGTFIYNVVNSFSPYKNGNVYLTLGGSLNYNKLKKEGLSNKEINKEVQQRSSDLIKITSLNLISNALDKINKDPTFTELENQLDKILEKLNYDDRNLSLIENKTSEEIIKKGIELGKGIEENFKEIGNELKILDKNSIEFYSNQINHL